MTKKSVSRRNFAMARAAIGVLAKGNIEAARVLQKVRLAHPRDSSFLRWCRMAEDHDVTGTKIVELFDQSGVTGVVLAVVDEERKALDDPLADALFSIFAPRIACTINERTSR